MHENVVMSLKRHDHDFLLNLYLAFFRAIGFKRFIPSVNFTIKDCHPIIQRSTRLVDLVIAFLFHSYNLDNMVLNLRKSKLLSSLNRNSLHEIQIS